MHAELYQGFLELGRILFGNRKYEISLYCNATYYTIL